MSCKKSLKWTGQIFYVARQSFVVSNFSLNYLQIVTKFKKFILNQKDNCFQKEKGTRNFQVPSIGGKNKEFANLP
jgi:hypothetical protein